MKKILWHRKVTESHSPKALLPFGHIFICNKQSFYFNSWSTDGHARWSQEEGIMLPFGISQKFSKTVMWPHRFVVNSHPRTTLSVLETGEELQLSMAHLKVALWPLVILTVPFARCCLSSSNNPEAEERNLLTPISSRSLLKVWARQIAIIKIAFSLSWVLAMWKAFYSRVKCIHIISLNPFHHLMNVVLWIPF